MAKEKVCEGKCDRCNERIVWKRGEKQASYSYTCQDCDFRGYAPAGSLAARGIEKLAPKPEARPEPAKPSPKPEPEAKPSPAKKAPSMWDIATGAARA